MSSAPHPYIDRRRTPRMENVGRLQARLVTGSTAIEIYDISAGGFSILSNEPFDAGAVLRFAIRPQVGMGSVELSARVRYCRPYTGKDAAAKYFTGLAFAALDANGRAAVDRLLDSLTSTLSFE